MVNLARHLEIDAEAALRRAATRFEGRFRVLEEALRARGEAVADASAATLEALWKAAKSR